MWKGLRRTILGPRRELWGGEWIFGGRCRCPRNRTHKSVETSLLSRWIVERAFVGDIVGLIDLGQVKWEFVGAMERRSGPWSLILRTRGGLWMAEGFSETAARVRKKLPRWLVAMPRGEWVGNCGFLGESPNELIFALWERGSIGALKMMRVLRGRCWRHGDGFGVRGIFREGV